MPTAQNEHAGLCPRLVDGPMDVSEHDDVDPRRLAGRELTEASEIAILPGGSANVVCQTERPAEQTRGRVRNRAKCLEKGPALEQTLPVQSRAELVTVDETELESRNVEVPGLVNDPRAQGLFVKRAEPGIVVSDQD